MRRVVCGWCGLAVEIHEDWIEAARYLNIASAGVVSHCRRLFCARYTTAAFHCDQSSLLGARRHELAHIGVRHAEALFEGLGEIGAVVAWVVELILIFNVQPAGVSYIG